MIDVKKLVTGFLILAVAASASAFLIANYGGNILASNQGSNTAAGISATGASSTTALAGNAFLPQDQLADADQTDSPDQPTLTSTTAAIANDPSNLTNILANNYLNNLVASNPSGPTTDSAGDENLTAPTNDSVISQFAASSSAASIKIPDWDAEAAEIPIVTLTASSDTVASYNTAVQEIINQNFVETNLESMMSGNSDPSAAGYAEQKVQTALQDIAGIKTPTSVVTFQKSLITLLVYEKNTLALAANAPTDPDPVKTSIILQSEEAGYNAAVENFASELSSDPGIAGLSFGGATSTDQGKVVAFIDQMAGIQTAHAQWITFDPTTFAQIILEYAKNILLQILKNVIVSIIQTKVLSWIRGSGTPRFIQNWATTLVNSYQTAALTALNNQFACINPAIAPQTRLLVTLPTPSVLSTNSCGVQFPAVLNSTNLSKFYNNFSNGGFATYLALFQPQGNPFSASMDLQDGAMNAGAINQQATQAKSIANQGFLGDGTCDDQSDPINGSHVVCPDGYEPDTNDSPMCIDSADETVVGVMTPNNGLCADGTQPQDTSPGAATGQVFNSAIDSGSNLVTSANDIVGLLNAALSSLMNSLATEAITATTGAFNNAITTNGTTNVGGATITTSGSGPNTSITATTPITCTPAQNTNSSGLVASLLPNSFILTASGGQTINNNGSQTNPQFVWSAPDGSPESGSGPTFITTYNATGTFVVTVTDQISNDSQTCTVNVTSLGN